MDLQQSVATIKGVGPKKLEKLNSLNIETVEDLLFYFPRTYEDRTTFLNLKDVQGEVKASFKVRVTGVNRNSYIRRNMHILSFDVEDETGKGTMTFFNQPFLKNSIKIGGIYNVYGKAVRERFITKISSPIAERAGENLKTGGIIPKYALKKGVTNNEIVKLIRKVNVSLPEVLPDYLIKKYALLSRNIAVKTMHFPDDLETLEKARKRLAFEELFLLQFALLTLKDNNRSEKSIKLQDNPKLKNFMDNLPFKLTEGQDKSLNEIINDLKSEKRMNRLLQGDVGSGKTIVAVIAMYFAYINGYQSTLMAPTEILAQQHYESVCELFKDENINVGLLTSSVSKKEREEILAKVRSGEIQMLIGTHSLINDEVVFKNLALTITDEQHRFGVKQRNTLQDKNQLANTLVMTATPIPRTLSLVLYGDLDISVIDTMPPGRKEIKTYGINTKMIDRALNFIKTEIEKGRQAYIICPLIDESEYMESLNSVIKTYENLKDKYFHEDVKLLHGQMKSEEKEEILNDFRDNKVKVIVSTTVIEVGINVPNATVMMVLNSERFGLAQLHQLRGRVGRGEHQSYCILHNGSSSVKSWERTKVMEKSSDGFFIANEDLRLRGPGEIFGTRQHGIPELTVSDFSTDYNILSHANIEASDIISGKVKISAGEHNKIVEEIYNRFKNTFILSHVN